MSGKRRTYQLYLSLTARERALMCVRAKLEGRPADPNVRQSMPLQQIDEFNRALARANGILHALVPSVALLCEQIESARLRFALLQNVVGLHVELASAFGAADEQTRAAADRVRDDCSRLCASLLAHQQAADEVVAEFDDEAVVPAVVRAMLAQARTELETLHADAPPLVGEIELPAADPEVLGHLRAGIGRDARLYV